MNLEQHIEGVLFYKAEPMKKAALAALFSVDPEEIDLALEALSKRLSGGGTRLTQTDETVQLVTAPDVSETIALLRKEELKRDIGKAGAETLAIILYRGPISRADIDRIRGVNSSFILRNLLIRGLIERRDHPKDHRSYVYAVTPDLLNHLGLTKREALPEFERIMSSIDTFEAGQDRIEKEERLLS